MLRDLGREAPLARRGLRSPLALILDEFWRDLGRREVSTKTIGNYQQVLRLVSTFWERYVGHPATLDDVTPGTAEAFVDNLLDREKTVANTQYLR